jgi:hypothetical protein
MGSQWSTFHSAEENSMMQTHCTQGVMRDFLVHDKRLKLRSYAQDEKVKKRFIDRAERDGIEGSLR